MSTASTPSAHLAALVETWWAAVEQFTALVEDLPEGDWERPTDLEGWRVRDVVAHLAHLEALTAGVEHVPTDIGDAPHVRNDMGRFTEEGVVARRDHGRDALLTELRESTRRRYADLTAHPPADPDAPAPGVFGLIGWSTGTLLANRPFDVFTHEQDVRHAVGRPGGLEGAPAEHALGHLLRSTGFVLGKKVGAGPGTTLVLTVGDLEPLSVGVGDDGRARPLPQPPADPTVAVALPVDAYLRAASGRADVPPGVAKVVGDHDLAERFLDALNVTP